MTSFLDLRERALRAAVSQSGDLTFTVVAPWVIVLSIVPEHHAFDGAQIWCASISRRGITPRSMPPSKWSTTQATKAEALLEEVLASVGDLKRSRCLVTVGAMYCQRALADSEYDPAMVLITRDAYIPMGPLEIRWSRGLPDRASALPCDLPELRPLTPNGAVFAADCGRCIPCAARAEVAKTGGPCRKSRAELAGARS